VSIFSRLAKNLKRGLRRVAPLLAPALGVVFPGVGGVIGSTLLGGLGGGGATPPIFDRPPLPGGGFIQPAAVRFAKRPIIQLPPVGTRTTQMSIFSSLPAILRGGRAAAGAIGRGLGSRTAAAAGAGVLVGQLLPDGSTGACPSGFHPAKDGSGRCVRNRRMNFGNARAARRSVRRLKGARKLLQDIEKMMPRRPAARPRRDLAAGHTHVR